MRVEVLGPQHDRASFESGAEPLDRYFRVQAGQDARKNMAAPFVLVLPDGTIAGYYTLSSTAVNVGDWPAQTVRKLPRYPLIPATLLGRLANRSGAAVLLCWCQRLPGNGPPKFALHIEAAPSAIADADPQRAVAALNAGVEAVAQRDFAQYQWTYKRYSLRPEGSGEENPYWDLYR